MGYSFHGHVFLMLKFSIQAYTNLLLTYLGKKFGEETEDSVLPEGVKPGSRVYLIVSDPLTKKDAALQRFVHQNYSLRFV